MAYNYSFEKLEVWRKSRKLVKQIYCCTKDFPSEEKYGLTNQLRRASISLSSNIAEGSTRWSKKGKSRFYEVAYGSLIEVLNQLILSNDLGNLNNEHLISIRHEIDEIGRMLDALYKSSNSSTIKLINSSTNKLKNQ